MQIDVRAESSKSSGGGDFGPPEPAVPASHSAESPQFSSLPYVSSCAVYLVVIAVILFFFLFFFQITSWQVELEKSIFLKVAETSLEALTVTSSKGVNVFSSMRN